MPRLRGLMGLCAPSSNISTLWHKAERDDTYRSSTKPSRLPKVESRLDACTKRNHSAGGVLVNHAALHYKHDAPNVGIVFQRVPIERNIERNDVRLQAGDDRANLIAQPSASAPSNWQRPSPPSGPNRSHACDR